VAIVAALHVGRELFVPLALAALFTFLLSPLVRWLQRRLGRVVAVACAVGLLCALMFGVGWIVTRQAVVLIERLPDYKENIRVKIQSIQLSNSAPLSKLAATWEDLKKEVPAAPANSSHPGPVRNPAAEPLAVEVISGNAERLKLAQALLSPVLGNLGTIALVVLLLIFMLLQQDDLLRRLIHLVDRRGIRATADALHEASSRVSKYLLTQLLVNLGYGACVAIGLFCIGVPSALLWGSLATVLRFIPYVGPWIAALLPFLMALAVTPAWTAPLLTIGLFVALELLVVNVVEPWLYGSSTGLTPFALVVSALAWTWLWGPVGLLLACPLTVCLVVLGRHVPGLRFVSVILSDEVPPTPGEECYHRLRSDGDLDAMEWVDAYLEHNPLADVFDALLIPALMTAESEYRKGELDGETFELVQVELAAILEELKQRQGGLPDADESLRKLVSCVPVKARRDQLAGEMLRQLLHQAGYRVRIAPPGMAWGALCDWIREDPADWFFILGMVPTSLSRVRYVCGKVQTELPTARVIATFLGSTRDANEMHAALSSTGIETVATTMSEAVLIAKSHD